MHFCPQQGNTELLTRLPTEEPHTVALAGLALVVTSKPIILASFVDNLDAQVKSIHCSGLGMAWKLQSKVIFFFIKKEGDD